MLFEENWDKFRISHISFLVEKAPEICKYIGKFLRNISRRYFVVFSFIFGHIFLMAHAFYEVLTFFGSKFHQRMQNSQEISRQRLKNQRNDFFFHEIHVS